MENRRSLWTKLTKINGNTQGPWLTMGDFGAVLHQEDRMHGSKVMDAKTRDFQELLDKTRLNEVRTSGETYIWTYGNVFSIIDKALVNPC